ncbi:MAG: thrombospondin type 3 repeat-containing protein [Saprospiraceae bacterium]|nr:thrombospondin type 3 repeat-containing protein [Candidatus Opimibacter iunctus]
MKSLYALALSLSFSLCLQAQSLNTWIGGVGNWNVASNWDLGVVPFPSQDVLIPGNGDRVSINLNVIANCGSISITDPGATLWVLGTLNIDPNQNTDGIINDGSILVFGQGTINITDTGGSGAEGDGIVNNGTLNVIGDLSIATQINESAIRNTSGATLTIQPAGEIIFGSGIGFRGINNVGGTVTNEGTIRANNALGAAFINSNSGGEVFNMPCANMHTSTNRINCDHLINDGTIFESSAENSTISENNGVVFNLGGGTFTIGTNTGHVTTTSNYGVWTGCTSTAIGVANNWAYIESVPNGNDQIIIPSNPQGVRFPISTATIIMNSPGQLTIEHGATFTWNGVTGNALANSGIVNVYGDLVINGTSNYGIRNEATGLFTSFGTSMINISNVADAAFRNDGMATFDGVMQFTNGIAKNGMISSGTSYICDSLLWIIANTGLSGIVNNGNMTSMEGSRIEISNTTEHGINNTGNFANTSIIEIGPGINGNGIQTSGAFDTKARINIMGANAGLHISNGGSLNINLCGEVTTENKINLNAGGLLTNIGLLTSLYEGGMHAISGQLTNNGIIHDMPESFNPESDNITNNEIILQPIATWPGGTFSPALIGDPPFMVSIVGNVFTEPAQGDDIGTYIAATNTFKDISGYSEGTYPFEAVFHGSPVCPDLPLIIMVTLDEDLTPDTDGDGIPDLEDNCPQVPNPQQIDTDDDGLGNACDPDDDNDGITDINDNCPLIVNADQMDTDDDGNGNACDNDDDNDGISDANDNCPLTPNQAQNDNDNDGMGNACDTDDDNDGILDSNDNCPFVSNTDQEDTDDDGTGNACDDDDDNDGILDNDDNCPLTANPGQNDNDNDGQGNACDTDDDNDGIPDTNDNCPFISNIEQVDQDGDGLGNECDDDDDNDGIPDTMDNCPYTPNPLQLDADNDGSGNPCDNDDDNDGIVDVEDNCQFTPNPGQEDQDGDFIGDACENDTDGDGILNAEDNCPTVPNPDQADADSDGTGDACEDDVDGDGIADNVDNCPLIPNTGQADNDNDGLGNVCDEDDDNDGILDTADNCHFTANADQVDTDLDGLGNV